MRTKTSHDLLGTYTHYKEKHVIHLLRCTTFCKRMNVHSVQQKSSGLKLSPEPEVTSRTVAVIIRVVYFPHICEFVAFLCRPFITINHVSYILTKDTNTFP